MWETKIWFYFLLEKSWGPKQGAKERTLTASMPAWAMSQSLTGGLFPPEPKAVQPPELPCMQGPTFSLPISLVKQNLFPAYHNDFPLLMAKAHRGLLHWTRTWGENLEASKQISHFQITWPFFCFLHHGTLSWPVSIFLWCRMPWCRYLEQVKIAQEIIHAYSAHVIKPKLIKIQDLLRAQENGVRWSWKAEAVEGIFTCSI